MGSVELHSVPAVSVVEKLVDLELASVEVRWAELVRPADLEELDSIVRRLKADSTISWACHQTRVFTASAVRRKGRAA